MTKLDYSKRNKNDAGFLNDPYWNDPVKGFDKAWHEQYKAKIRQNEKLKKNLGIHESHDWQPIEGQVGPHAGKAVCNTCGGKFIMWLPKGFFKSNT